MPDYRLMIRLEEYDTCAGRRTPIVEANRKVESLAAIDVDLAHVWAQFREGLGHERQSMEQMTEALRRLQETSAALVAVVGADDLTGGVA